ncbi:MAG: undecaprenyl/decaprenyl-phosphate alpha-N-acetylglucosaminyl 1-phosphate transferase [Selenomonadaceae bacterium]|nr:undecaprenyl/decaprenyl-phosphate alpha-N-acetylglucosaminyl 1-phosphate transferase [Selenomonadaceae bacterium]MBP3722882.1 undecaprenyl/decaprenyl-phosphate alpha-N-acetylglucosaminyl 1-phosphate transferase [Selenomonadaceae bacterium]
MEEYLLAFFATLSIVLLITPFVIELAKKTGALDVPDKRKVHKEPIARIGGTAIYIAFTSVVLGYFFINGDLALEISGLLVSGTFIFLVGIIDDYKNIPAKVKLLGQIAAALILALFFNVRIEFISDPFGDYLFLEEFAIPVTVLWIVSLTNTVNLIDGLDGLAAGVSAIACVTIFLVALEQNVFVVAFLTAALAGSAFGFLYYNFNPARIFMGDSGSMFLGFILAGISIIGSVKSAAALSLIVPILALGLPIMDTAFAIIRRKRAGVPIFKPDRGHLHHRLLDLGLSQRQAVLLMYVISSLLGMAAISITLVNSGQIAMIIIVAVLFMVLYGAKKIGIFRMNEPPKTL